MWYVAQSLYQMKMESEDLFYILDEQFIFELFNQLKSSCSILSSLRSCRTADVVYIRYAYNSFISLV